MYRLLLIFIAIFIASGCGGKSSGSQDKKLTQHQRDSVLSRSKLPGAGTVGKALIEADSAKARADRLNEQFK